MGFVLFAVLNVVTANFIEAAMAAAAKDKQDRMTAILSECFNPKQGRLLEVDRRQFEDSLTDPRVIEFLKILEMDSESAVRYDLFGLMDTNMDGMIEAQELVDSCVRL